MQAIRGLKQNYKIKLRRIECRGILTRFLIGSKQTQCDAKCFGKYNIRSDNLIDFFK